MMKILNQKIRQKIEPTEDNYMEADVNLQEKRMNTGEEKETIPQIVSIRQISTIKLEFSSVKESKN